MVANVTHAHMSHVQIAHTFFLLKDPDPVLKFGDNLSSRNKDIAQNVISQGCDLERSRSFVKVKMFSIRP